MPRVHLLLVELRHRLDLLLEPLLLSEWYVEGIATGWERWWWRWWWWLGSGIGDSLYGCWRSCRGNYDTARHHGGQLRKQRESGANGTNERESVVSPDERACFTWTYMESIYGNAGQHRQEGLTEGPDCSGSAYEGCRIEATTLRVARSQHTCKCNGSPKGRSGGCWRPVRAGGRGLACSQTA